MISVDPHVLILLDERIENLEMDVEMLPLVENQHILDTALGG